jgi:hypothetical protein
LRRMHIAAESENAPNDPPRRDWFRQPAPRIPRFNLLPAPVSDVGYWRKADVRAAKLQKVSNALAP